MITSFSLIISISSVSTLFMIYRVLSSYLLRLKETEGKFPLRFEALFGPNEGHLNLTQEIPFSRKIWGWLALESETNETSNIGIMVSNFASENPLIAKTSGNTRVAAFEGIRPDIASFFYRGIDRWLIIISKLPCEYSQIYDFNQKIIDLFNREALDREIREIISQFADQVLYSNKSFHGFCFIRVKAGWFVHTYHFSSDPMESKSIRTMESIMLPGVRP